jgi:hypothetical protein
MKLKQFLHTKSKPSFFIKQYLTYEISEQKSKFLCCCDKIINQSMAIKLQIKAIKNSRIL